MSPTEKRIAIVLGVVLVAMMAVYFGTQPKPVERGMAMGAAASTPGPAGGPAGAPDASVCAPSGVSGGSVATQEFGKNGAKLEIIAALPITHGCHVQTEAELKKAYENHPSDIHLVIYDLFGPEGQKFASEHGGQRAVVFINGESSFKLNGKDVKLEVMEGHTYVPADILPIIEAELSKAG